MLLMLIMDDGLWIVDDSDGGEEWEEHTQATLCCRARRWKRRGRCWTEAAARFSSVSWQTGKLMEHIYFRELLVGWVGWYLNGNTIILSE